MKKEMFFVYVLDVTEHERGWGMRPDGYVCFVDGEVAHQWRLERYKDRNTNSVPECYDTYENGRWEPVHESIHTKVQECGSLWVKSLKDVIKPTSTRQVQLVWVLELETEDYKLTDDELFNKYMNSTPDKGKLLIKT